MMSDNTILFEEKQYLGYNRFSLLRRTIIALFCFLTYFFADEIEPLQSNYESTKFLFFMGIFILILSIILVFILHLHTKVINSSLILDGLWTARRVKIDLTNIKSVTQTKYSKYFSNRPVYNLHFKGKIKFYTRGSDAIEIIDNDGQIYLLGTQRSSELYEVLSKFVK